MLDNRTSLDMKLCVLHYLASVNLFMGGHPDNEWQRDDRGFPAGIEKWECLIVLESKRYAFWGRRNNRDMMRTTATRPAIRSTVSNQEAARPLKSQKTTRAPEPIQRFFGMTSRVSQPLQAKGFPRPHWVFRNGTVLPQAGHRGDKETILANLSKNQMPAMAS